MNALMISGKSRPPFGEPGVRITVIPGALAGEMAELKGLSRRRILLRHALLEAIPATIQVVGLSLLYLAGGIVVIEYVFNYPGVGYMLLRAVNNQDYPLMQALFLIITVGVLVAVLIADFITMWLDPRTRAEA